MARFVCILTRFVCIMTNLVYSMTRFVYTYDTYAKFVCIDDKLCLQKFVCSNMARARRVGGT